MLRANRRPRFKPSGIPKVNLSHPLAQGMTSCFIPAGALFVDVFRSRIPSTGGTASVHVPGSSVSGWSVTNAATADLNWTSGPFSAAVFCNLSASIVPSSDYVDMFGRQSYVGEGNNGGWSLQYRQSNDAHPGWNFIVFSNGTSPQYDNANGGLFASGDRMVGGSSDGTTKRTFFDGAQVGSTTSASLTAGSSTGALTNVNGPTLSSTYIGCTWNRCLTAAEFFAFYADPFDVLSYAERDWSPILSAVPAAGGASVTYPQLERFRPRGLTRGLAA